jgi:hypothetical protein
VRSGWDGAGFRSVAYTHRDKHRKEGNTSWYESAVDHRTSTKEDKAAKKTARQARWRMKKRGQHDPEPGSPKVGVSKHQPCLFAQAEALGSANPLTTTGANRTF